MAKIQIKTSKEFEMCGYCTFSKRGYFRTRIRKDI